MESIKIAGLVAENVKRIQAVDLKFNENGLNVIGGDNKEGKTSLLDTICYVLGGEKYRPTKIKREGAITEPYLQATLSNGLIAERKGKNSSLTVTDPTGKRAGQTLLDSFIEELALNLSAFINAKPKEKAKILLDTLGIGEQLSKMEKEEKKLFDERTEVGRIAERKKKYSEELEWYADIPEETQKISELLDKRQEIMNENIRRERKQDKLKNIKSQYDAKNSLISDLNQDLEIKKTKVSNIIESISKLGKKISDLMPLTEIKDESVEDIDKQIAALQEKKNLILIQNNENAKNREKSAAYLKEIESIRATRLELQSEEEKLAGKITVAKSEADALSEEINKMKTETDINPLPTEEIDKQIAGLEDLNEKVRKNISKKEAIKEANKMEAEYNALTKKIEDVRAAILALLNGAKMPLPNMSINKDDYELMFNSVKWDCMSGAEHLIAATAIVKSLKPECGFVLIDGIEAMDCKTLSEFNEWLKKENLQAIATRVSKGEECTIIIENGCARENNNIEKEPVKDELF